MNKQEQMDIDAIMEKAEPNRAESVDTLGPAKVRVPETTPPDVAKQITQWRAEGPPTTAITRRSGVPTPADLMANYAQTMDMCTMFAAATLMNAKDQQQAKAQVFLAVMKGAEMGLAPASALTEIYVLPGDGGAPKFVVSARAMAGVCVAHGVIVEPPVEEKRGQTCSVTVRRHGHPYTATWTLTRAQAAGLSEKKNWVRHPMEMLRARATAEACRMACPDLLCGVYVNDEADDEKAASRADTGRNAEAMIAEMPEGAPNE